MTIGIIPAGGKAERMGGIPKMLLPLPATNLFDLLLHRMLIADSIVVDAADAVAPFLAGSLSEHDFLVRLSAPTMSYSVLLSRGYAGNERVLFGMPDTYFEDANAFPKLIAALDKGADVAVGVFDARPGQYREGGMCTLSISGRVVDVTDKPERWRDDGYIWGVLAWEHSFWPCIKGSDPHVGYALPRAIAAGLDVRAVHMEGGFWDCGTPERYFALIRHLTAEAAHAT